MFINSGHVLYIVLKGLLQIFSAKTVSQKGSFKNTSPTIGGYYWPINNNITNHRRTFLSIQQITKYRQVFLAIKHITKHRRVFLAITGPDVLSQHCYVVALEAALTKINE